MRIIIRHCSPWGNFTTHGFDMEGKTDVSELNDKIFEKFSISNKLQILRYKRDGVTLKLIPGWSLDFYGVKDKSIIFLEKFEFQKEEDDYKQRSYIAKGGYFAKLGILTKVEEEDEEEENGPYAKKTSKTQKDSISITQFASNHGSRGASNKASDSPSDTIISSDDESSYKKSNGELYKERKGPKQLEERDRLIKAVKGNSMEKLKEVFSLYNEDPEKEAKICKLIDENNYGGWNLLHWAVYLGYGDLVGELMRLGANINIVSSDGWTPLQLSAHTNHLEVAKMLVRDPLRIELDKITHRMSALHIAAKNGKPEMAALLLQQGADFKIKNEQGDLPADITTNEKVKQLIEYTSMKRAIEQFSPPKPPIVRGYMYKRGDYLFKMNKRYFVLNPEEGTLIRYASKEDCPNKPMEIIPLKSIEGARRMNAGQFYDKSLCYIQLLYQRRHILACHNEAIANQWVMFIIQGAVYTNYLEQNIEKEVTKSMAGSIGADIASYFGRVTEEIELDDIPSKRDGLNMKSQAPIGKSEPAAKNRQTTSFQEQRVSPVKKQEEQKRVEKKEKPEDLTPTSKEYEDELLEIFDEKVNFQSFQILKVLGSGAFGKVYKVRKKDNKKIYAMKALRKRNLILKNQLRYAVTEANVLKSTNHPFILSLHYAFQTPQYLYLIIDYCPGGDLSLHLANKGTFTEEETRYFMAELILAIEHLHSKDVIYRDLKPENILVTSDGHIKLADFGLSKEGIGENIVAKSFCGSPAYLSPDMLKNKGVGKPADIYGMGTVMYEMLVGESPFYSDDIPKMYNDIKKANLVIPKNLSDPARHLISKLLDRDPNQRPGVKNRNDLRNHPFFAGINWEKLERKELPPPNLDPLDEEEIEMPINTNHPFVDVDYDEQNKFANRVKQFTFVNKG